MRLVESPHMGKKVHKCLCAFPITVMSLTY